MKFLSKTVRALALALAVLSVLCAGLPALADTKDQGSMTFNLSTNKEQTFDVVIASPNVAVSSINISKSSNCGILSTLKGSCVSRGDNKVFTLTVKANSGGTATFDYTYSYNYNDSDYTYVTHVTLNVTGPTPEPATPVVSIVAGPQNAQTGACTLTATLSGCSKYAYEWYVNTSNSTSGGTLLDSGTTSKSTITHDCTFKSSKTADYYYYYVTVRNADSSGSAVSSKVIQLVNPYSPSYNTPTPAPANLPVITKHPGSESIDSGDSASFVVKATNYESVLWYMTLDGTTFKASKAANYISGISVSGYKTTTLKLSNIPASANGCEVYAVFTNASGSIETDRATIAVDTDTPVVTLTAGDQDGSTGACTLTAKFSGCSKYAYEWYVNTTNSTTGATLLKSGTTTSKSVSREMTFKSTKTDPYYYYYIKVWNAADSEDNAVYSSAIRLANPYSSLNPSITKHPTGETVTEGGSATFIARADDYDTITWYLTNGSSTIAASKGSSRFSGLKVSGYSEEKLKLSNIPASLDGWSVFATFENDDGSIDTNKAKITVNYDSSSDDEDDDYNYSYTWRPTATPLPTAYSVTPIPELPTPTPTLTPHVHEYPTTESYDSTYHWHECECGDQGDIGVHQMTYYNSSSNKNVRVGVCSICGYTTEETVSGSSSSTGSSLFTKLMIFLGILFLGAIGVLIYVLIKEKQRKEEARKAAAIRRRQQERRRREAAKAAKKKAEAKAAEEGYTDLTDDFDEPAENYRDDESDEPDGPDDDDDDGPFNLFDK